MDIAEIADRVEKLLKGRSLDGYEIMTGSSRTLSIEVKDSKVDSFKSAEPSAVGVRVLKESGLGFSYSSVFAESDLERMIDSACVGAAMQTPDPFGLLPPAAGYDPMPELFDPALMEVDVSRKIERALELERLALLHDSRVKRVRKAVYGESVYSVHLRNSRGLCGGYSGTSVSSSVSAIAESGGDSQMGWEFAYANSFDAIDIRTIAEGAAQRAVRQLGARRAPGMCCPVILENHVAADFLDLLAPSFSAENLHKGKSLLKGKVDERLFADLIRVRDDGGLKGGMATSPFDGEGVPVQNTLLVDAGIVKGYLFDTAYAARMGASSTGNSARSGVKGLPHLGISNFFIENGSATSGDLLSGIGKGMMITSVIGMHTANPVSGDFSIGATGFLIEDGQITVPVKGVALSGNVLDLFRNVEMIGADLRFFSQVGSPSLRINSLEISGD